jgi:hypothetical protein
MRLKGFISFFLSISFPHRMFLFTLDRVKRWHYNLLLKKNLKRASFVAWVVLLLCNWMINFHFYLTDPTCSWPALWVEPDSCNSTLLLDRPALFLMSSVKTTAFFLPHTVLCYQDCFQSALWWFLEGCIHLLMLVITKTVKTNCVQFWDCDCNPRLVGW